MIWCLSFGGGLSPEDGLAGDPLEHLWVGVPPKDRRGGEERHPRIELSMERL